jgi:hypothetical protein
MCDWYLSGYLTGKEASMPLSQGFLNQGSNPTSGLMTRAEKLESLAKTLRRYPDLAAKMILDIGVEWDGKVLCNKDANELEDKLLGMKQALDEIRANRKG